DRVHMANIAQMINVLQAMLLTDGEKMIKTPTYHVFDMYKYHQDAQLVEAYGDTSEFVDYTISKKDNKLAVSVTNFGLENEETVKFNISGLNKADSEGWILTADQMDAHNTFEDPENVTKENFTNYKLEEGKLSVTLPSKSVITLLIDLD